MGNSEVNLNSSYTEINIKDFKLEKIIGKGSLGDVWKATFKPTNSNFALKLMHKSRVVRTNSVNPVLKELKLLTILKHPFIVNMQHAFQDRENLYLAMDLMPGGDLRYYLTKHHLLNENQTRFLVCCILLGLEYLHINCIIHRDIKPENLVFDSKGYLRITDFGISHMLGEEFIVDSSGTPGYMSPEALLRRPHDTVSDFFALGVVAYECMLGKIPYCGKNRREIRDKIISKQIQLKKIDVPEGWSLESADFINKLLQRKPNERLGYNGAQEIKNHSWIADVEWKKFMEKRILSPCKVDSLENFKAYDSNLAPTDTEFDFEYVQSYFSMYQFTSGANLTTPKQYRNRLLSK